MPRGLHPRPEEPSDLWRRQFYSSNRHRFHFPCYFCPPIVRISYGPPSQTGTPVCRPTSRWPMTVCTRASPSPRWQGMAMKSKRSKTKRTPVRRRILAYELLEDRSLLSTVIVTTTTALHVAVATATAGEIILLAPGTYGGGSSGTGLTGVTISSEYANHGRNHRCHRLVNGPVSIEPKWTTDQQFNHSKLDDHRN